VPVPADGGDDIERTSVHGVETSAEVPAEKLANGRAGEDARRAFCLAVRPHSFLRWAGKAWPCRDPSARHPGGPVAGGIESSSLAAPPAHGGFAVVSLPESKAARS